MNREFNNTACDSKPAGPAVGSVGGNKKIWNISDKLGQNIKNSMPLDGDVMREELRYVVENIDKLSSPHILDPSTATFTDISLHAILRQRLSPSTVEKNLRYLSFMENHTVRVNIRDPEFVNFLHHADYRERIEKATPDALKHEWKAMKMLLSAFGVSHWPYKPPTSPHHSKRNLPFPLTVRKFFYYPYSPDEYERNLYQYLFYLSFLVGWRVPSEICEMKTSDILFDIDGHGSITIRETKKRRSERTIVPESFILTSQSHKSFKNWLDVWRPRVENQHSGDALFLQPSGKPFTVRHLGHKLSEHGKQIWPEFRPYDMRHWCAVARLIQTKIDTGYFDTYQVGDWLGHELPSTTQIYVKHANQYYRQYKESWIQHALSNSIRWNWVKHVGPRNRVLEFFKTLPSFSPVNLGKSLRAHYSLQEKTQGEFLQNLKLSFYWAVKFLITRGFESRNLFSQGVGS